MSKAQAWRSYGALPMSFEVNRGQADSTARYLARGAGYTILLGPAEATLALQSSQPNQRFPEKAQPKPTTRVLRMRIEGANLSAPATALDRLPGVSNYIIGNDPSRWHTNIPTYKKVRFEQIRPGVDLVYYGNQSQLEYDFVLSPGVAPQSLGMSFEGSEAAINPHGDLVFSSTDGQMIFHRPVAYQNDKSNPAQKHFLAASYVLRGHNRVGFEVPGYDPREPLVIDPSLSYSTYLGGSGGDTGNAIALDALFDAYITGSTSSSNFPKGAQTGYSPYQGSYGGDTDAFVTKLRYDGQAIIFSTYLGGNNYDIGQGIAVDSSADVYVVGSTQSANFPTTASAFQTTYGGNTDAFVSKLDPSGSKLLFSSFLGGSDIDYGLALAIDPSGNMFVTGSTQSTDFPTVLPIQAGNSGNGDAFVAEIDTNLPQTQQLVYSTYLGGSSADSGQGIAVDSGDNAYVTGFTFSTNFPVSSNAYQTANAGSVDAFITVLSAGGGSYAFSTYLGGTGDDRAWAIALDSQNNIYIAGSTYTACSPATSTTTLCSPISTFPTTSLAYQTYTTKQAPGYPVAFVTEMNHFGTNLIYSTLLGGSLSDAAAGIAVDTAGNAYVTGYTESSDFPTANAVQASYVGGNCGSNPCQDAFVTEVNPQGTSLVYSTYLAGSNGTFGNAIAVDTNANAYIAGSTFSQNFPAIALAYQGESGNSTGLSSIFISMISHNNVPAVALTPQKINFGNVTENTTVNVTSENVPSVVTLMNPSTAPLQITGVATTGDFAETNDCVGTLPAGGGVCTISVTYTPTVLAQQTELLSITDNAAGSPHLVTLTGTGVTGIAQVQFSPTALVFPATVLNTTSATQTVTMTNDGQTPLTVTNIAATPVDFSETNTCPFYPFTMAVGGSCNFSVTFAPTRTGVIKGSLTITDNVTSGASSIALSGTGDPNFTLSSPTTSEFLPIGTTTTTFNIALSAPKSLNFTDTVSLSCSPGSCAFDPSNIALNQTTVPSSSILTLGGLSPTSPNPYIFNVNGADITSGNETATLNLSVYFGDFSISATPAVGTISSGATQIYTVTVSPINNFSQAVLLSCGTLPKGALCLANPASLTPQNGAAVSAQLSVSTTAQSTTTTGHVLPRAAPRIPPPTPMVLALWGACSLLMLVVFLVRWKLRSRGSGKRRRLIFAQVALAMLALAAMFWISCNNDIYTNVIQPSTINGTPTGNYVITILGTYTGSTAGIKVVTGSQTTVIRATSVNLVVQ